MLANSDVSPADVDKIICIYNYIGLKSAAITVDMMNLYYHYHSLWYVCKYVCMRAFVTRRFYSLRSHECTPVGQTEKMCFSML